MILVGLNFFNEGAQFMIILACTIQYFFYFELEPGLASLHIACIVMPEGLAVFYGYLADSISIGGKKFRFCIILAAGLQVAACLFVVIFFGL